MKFDLALSPATLIRRYKRFLADVVLGGAEVTVYCPNTGAMSGCDWEGAGCWLSESDNPKRKYRHTWEIVEADNDGRPLVGINTGRTNGIVAEAIEANRVELFKNGKILRREPPNPLGRGRFDLLVEDALKETWFVEVKNVTAGASQGRAVFPDAVTTRGARHMDDLAEARRQGLNAALVFLRSARRRPNRCAGRPHRSGLRRRATSGSQGRGRNSCRWLQSWADGN